MLTKYLCFGFYINNTVRCSLLLFKLSTSIDTPRVEVLESYVRKLEERLQRFGLFFSHASQPYLVLR